MGIQFHPIVDPHRQFPAVARDRQSVVVLPGPVRPGSNPFQLAFQPSRQEPLAVADKVAVDIVRVVLLFDERSVDENLGDSDSLQFRCQMGQILNELRAPWSIPVPRAFLARGTTHQPGFRQLAERQDVISDRQQPVRVERGESPADSGHT